MGEESFKWVILINLQWVNSEMGNVCNELGVHLFLGIRHIKYIKSECMIFYNHIISCYSF